MKDSEQFMTVVLTVIFATAIVSIMAMIFIGWSPARGAQIAYASPNSQPVFVQEPAPVVVEQPAQIVAPVVEEPVEVPVEPVVEVPAELELSLAEQYLDEFYSKASSYSYDVRDEVHGQMRVKVTTATNDMRFQAKEKLFVFSEETGEVEKSEATAELTMGFRKDSSTWTPYLQAFVKDLEKRKRNEMNTIWWDDWSESYTGCFVTSRHTDLNHCVIDSNASNHSPIIFVDFAFSRTETPEEVLQEFIGETPAKVYEPRSYAIQRSTAVVKAQEIVYDNGDGTQTKLYIHDFYKIPLQMDVIDDRVVTRSIVFDAITFEG